MANVARARESGLQGNAETLHDAEDLPTCAINIRHLMLILHIPTKGRNQGRVPDIRHHILAIMGLGGRHGRIVIKQSNAAQRIKQSKSHEYHFPIPLVFEIKHWLRHAKIHLFIQSLFMSRVQYQ